MSDAEASSNVPASRPNNLTPSHNDDVPQYTARLPTSMHIGSHTHRCDARSVLVAIAPAGTLWEDAMCEELLRRSLFLEWADWLRISLTCKDLKIADQDPNVAFALSLETTAA